MIKETQVSPQMSLRGRIRRWLAPGIFIMALVALGLGVSAKWLLSAPPPEQIYQKQTAVQAFVRSVRQVGDSTHVSGAYVPGAGYMLYSQVGVTDEFQVRSWVSRFLASQVLLSDAAGDEDLTWIIDYGNEPTSQLIVKTSLRHAADPTAHRLIHVPPTEVMVASAPVPMPTTLPVDNVEVADEVDQSLALEQEIVAADTQLPTAASQPESAAQTEALQSQALPDSPPQSYSSDFENMTSGWMPMSGQWEMANGVYSQLDANGYDFITMFDTAAGSSYNIEARFRHLEGAQGAGIVYHAPDPNSRADAQVVDFAEQGSFLRWGYYDGDEKYQYVGGVAVSVPVADGEWHSLRLAIDEAITTVYVDGQELAQLENTRRSGYIGLVTSQAKVDFDDVTLGAVDEEGRMIIPQNETERLELVALPISQFEDSFEDDSLDAWKTVDGSWEILNAELHQMERGVDNAAALSPFHGDSYSVSAKVRRLESRFDAGLYFNMALPNARVTGQFIRLNEERGLLEWGHVDEATNLVVEGEFEAPEISSQNEHLLELQVRDGSASIRLNNQTAAESVPLLHASGYVGLLSNQDPVAFDDVLIVANNEG